MSISPRSQTTDHFSHRSISLETAMTGFIKNLSQNKKIAYQNSQQRKDPGGFGRNFKRITI
ncbi:hypothetical protein LEP1GSC005_0859 [Leptospira santarosai str. ST188]|nr:hypothetical protein LEP1GSC005_0859 [Leptospira santarosai str. ST188]